MRPAFSTSSAVDANDPLASFSLCHAGITSQLHACEQMPELLEAGARGRQLAADLLRMFEEDVMPHHADEEKELFPAVLRSAQRGAEATRIEGLVRRLVAEHRAIERLWADLQPEVKAAARHGASPVNSRLMAELVTSYLAHAQFEEEHFLPLAQEVLGRNGNHMMALGMSLHLRHVKIPGGASYI